MAACAKLDPPIKSQNWISCARLDHVFYLSKYGIWYAHPLKTQYIHVNWCHPQDMVSPLHLHWQSRVYRTWIPRESSGESCGHRGGRKCNMGCFHPTRKEALHPDVQRQSRKFKPWTYSLSITTTPRRFVPHSCNRCSWDTNTPESVSTMMVCVLVMDNSTV